MIGQLLGGIIPKCANLGLRGTIWMQVISAYICVACSFAFLAKCDSTPLAGHNTDYVIFNEWVHISHIQLMNSCSIDFILN